jgi:hypothetical protein
LGPWLFLAWLAFDTKVMIPDRCLFGSSNIVLQNWLHKVFYYEQLNVFVQVGVGWSGWCSTSFIAVSPEKNKNKKQTNKQTSKQEFRLPPMNICG